MSYLSGNNKGMTEYEIVGLDMIYFNSCIHLVICTNAKNSCRARLSFFFSFDFLAFEPLSYIKRIFCKCFLTSSSHNQEMRTEGNNFPR